MAVLYHLVCYQLHIQALLISGTNIFVGTQTAGAFISTNNGSNWTTINSGLPATSVTALAVLGSNIYAGNSGFGVYKSTNNGTNWTSSGMTNKSVIAFAVSGTALVAGTIDSGIYSSTNNGTSWFKRNQGFNVSPTVLSFAISNNYVFSGIRYYCVFRRPLNEVIGIHNISTEIPASFSLSQNYPNPFNPVTNIRYQIANNTFVCLKIFDILGKEVETLVNETKAPGIYEVNWNAARYSSGVYFYKLQADGFTQTRKMLLTK